MGKTISTAKLIRALNEEIATSVRGHFHLIGWLDVRRKTSVGIMDSQSLG